MTMLDSTFHNSVGIETPEPFSVVCLGQRFTIVDNPKPGALVVLMRRLDDKSTTVQVGAVLRLMEAWIVPADHERLYDAVADLDDVKTFMETDFARFIEEVTNRPT